MVLPPHKKKLDPRGLTWTKAKPWFVKESIQKKEEEAVSIVETTTTTVGSNAITEKKEIENAKMTKGEIRDRIIDKYKAEQKIKKQEYDENHSDDGLSDGEKEELYDGMHPIDYKTMIDMTYLRALAELEIPPVEEECFCPISKGNRQWRWKNNVSMQLGANCGINRGRRQNLMHHLREVGSGRDPEPLHKYTLEFIEEWRKQE